MLNRKICATMASMAILLLLAACGPETIYVRPNLDTPERHVANGQVLLDQQKTKHALREFQRANELDPQNVAALVGIAIVMGHDKKFNQGMEALEKAQALSTTAEDKALVRDGQARLEELRTKQ